MTKYTMNLINLNEKRLIMEDYKVSDIKLAEWGRKEIQIAETEMPG